MIYRTPRIDERSLFDKLVNHPVQSWAWGDFRASQNTVIRRSLGFEGKQAINAFTVSFHKIPHTPYTVGYYPKGTFPDEIQIAALKDMAERENAIVIKMEPDVSSPPHTQAEVEHVRDFLLESGSVNGKPLFTKYSFIIDLKNTDAEILANMKSKTRYNIGIAQKHGVKVVEDNSDAAFNIYLQLLNLTTGRQKFYSHTEKYHQDMFHHMRQAGIAHLLRAEYNNMSLVTWILFHFQNKLYYPYGASSRDHRDVMSSHAVMWESIQLGKRLKATSFDLWGALPPNPDPHDPWFGFHNFKSGFGAKHVEFVGTYDLIIKPQLYKLYNLADKLRWKYLRLRSKLGI